MQLEFAQAAGLFLQALEFGLSHPGKSALKDERHYLMQFTAIQKRSMAAARVDDGA